MGHDSISGHVSFKHVTALLGSGNHASKSTKLVVPCGSSISHSRPVMDPNHKLELMNIAIQRVIDERKIKQSSGDVPMDGNVDDRHLLSGLLSQLESLKGGDPLEVPEASIEMEKVSSPEVDNVDSKMEVAGEVDGGSSVEMGTEEILKELKEVRKQNLVTHCLLSVMIVLTLGWQLSEVSLILKVKDGLSNPFRSIGRLLWGKLKGPDRNGEDAGKKPSLIEAAASSVKMPELPHVDLPDLDSVLNSENH